MGLTADQISCQGCDLQIVDILSGTYFLCDHKTAGTRTDILCFYMKLTSHTQGLFHHGINSLVQGLKIGFTSWEDAGLFGLLPGYISLKIIIIWLSTKMFYFPTK